MKKNYIEEHFTNLINYVKEKDYEQLYEIIKNNFTYHSKNNYYRFKSITNFYNEHKLWGEIDLENNNFELIENNTKSLIEHYKDYEWVFNNLADYRSKKIILYVMLYWIMLDSKNIEKLDDKFYSQYFDLDLIKCTEDEIFVDVGAYTGDTLLEYINVFGKENYKKIYCYEIVPQNLKLIEDVISKNKLENIIVKSNGVSNNNEKMYIDDDVISSTSVLKDTGTIEIDSIKIDDDIKGPVTFIKMDIEGGELKALEGMKNKIKKYKPKLAICLYHNNTHLWQIPKLIHELNPKYKFYLRYYGGPILPTEYILYAV